MSISLTFAHADCLNRYRGNQTTGGNNEGQQEKYLLSAWSKSDQDTSEECCKFEYENSQHCRDGPTDET